MQLVLEALRGPEAGQAAAGLLYEVASGLAAALAGAMVIACGGGSMRASSAAVEPVLHSLGLYTALLDVLEAAGGWGTSPASVVPQCSASSTPC